MVYDCPASFFARGRLFLNFFLFPFSFFLIFDPMLTPDDVRKVAKLARLELPEESLPKLTGQLESILHYIEKIGRVDMSDVEPMAHALPVKNVLRGDVAQAGLPLEKVLQNAPETDGPFFKVPKVIGGEEDSAG
jgi:aspartyl-tRNA(Asn)/glutamyl-tRNA(Gln) amidotransferase subunit C